MPRAALTVGLALGGGAARGFAHIGVIRALQKHGVPIDRIVGTSMGAVIGAAYAYGLDLDRLERLLGTIDLHEVLHLPRSGFEEAKTLAGRLLSEQLFRRGGPAQAPPDRRMERLCQFFTTFLGEARFRDLHLPFAAVAADLTTGERVVIQEGRVCRAIEASSAIPGLYGPVAHRGHTLIDGGVVDPVPVEVAFALGADLVIAVDVSSPLEASAEDVRGPLQELFRAEAILIQALIRTKYELVRRRYGEERLVVLRPELSGIRWSSFDQVGAIVAAGEREAERRIEAIQEAIEQAEAEVWGPFGVPLPGKSLKQVEVERSQG